ncbi:MAG: Gfo/Idh/MocA family oxidoreductase [Meiothermus sp.]|nr:Gfo/Idh/MocA family oxidoreductase [Meiothermus sp.]
MKTLRFGVIGCGLMGREFGSAAARWMHLNGMGVRPVIVAVCDTNPKLMEWFGEHFPSVRQATTDYQELLSNPEVDAVYCAVPHNLHAQLYADIIGAGKHLFGEKPFGIDLEANARINAAIAANPGVLVRCSSEFPFFPAVQKIVRLAQEERFGRIIEVEAGFWHSSDLDPAKPINWKRMVAVNGEYGVMGDLGFHVTHLPSRLGWVPQDVRAVLSNIVSERPDGKGGLVPCETWDNATLLTSVRKDDYTFPMTLSMKRIAPSETNTWFVRVMGTKLSAEFSTKRPKTLRTLPYTPGQPQAWLEADLGYETAYPGITGGIFEFGFPDAILQMWAAFCDELAGNEPRFRCGTPEEAAFSHRLFTAALKSHKTSSVVQL